MDKIIYPFIEHELFPLFACAAMLFAIAILTVVALFIFCQIVDAIAEAIWSKKNPEEAARRAAIRMFGHPCPTPMPKPKLDEGNPPKPSPALTNPVRPGKL